MTGVPLPVAPAHSGTEHFINRELSWLKFNERVLEEALDAATPLLERVNFLSIFGSNLDEFFMVRVSGLRGQMEAGVLEAPPDGMTPTEQLMAIRYQLLPSLAQATSLWMDDLLGRLAGEGIHVTSYDALKSRQRTLLRDYFRSEIFPVLTPLASDPGHPFPHISNLSVNLAVVLHDEEHGRRFARLKVPASFPRLLRVPDEERAAQLERLGFEDQTSSHFVWMEEVIKNNLDLLFPGVEVVAAYPFRVTRDADFEIEEDEAADLLLAMSEVVEQRHFGSAIRLEIDQDMPSHVEDLLLQNLGLLPFLVYRTRGPIGVSDLRELTKLERPDLKYAPFLPKVPSALAESENLFSVVRERDVLLYHPYDSFQPVVNFVRQAAEDPKVLAIKQTLYRVGPGSPIVKALMRARENGKQVAVLVELKARFDEENNITWARALERVGVHVVYGVVGLKTHAKLCLVVRRERDGMRRYVHMATGNYNPITARIYTDLGYFTADPDIADDVQDLFNALTGMSRKTDYRKLLVAPHSLRKSLLARIDREVARHEAHGDGRIVFKVNSLTDPAIIRALYRASQAGVRVDLQVRGICCLRPGVPGLSETIDVTSIVGRLLEHTRIYYFHNGGEEELLSGSADMMTRNLDGRVETIFPIQDERLRRHLRDDILFLHLRDDTKARRLRPDGTWERVQTAGDGPGFGSQRFLIEHGGPWRAAPAEA
ncbi:MAG: polyphosphate kinase 1 [Myxococcota bacterium]